MPRKAQTSRARTTKNAIKTRFQQRFSVALVEPEYAINVGYVARIMANFGLAKLYVVGNSLAHINLNESQKFASHGYPLVDRIQAVKSLRELRKKFEILVGTTAISGKRKSNITRKTTDIIECTERIADLLSENKDFHVCLVLGRDTTGLTNEELQQCDFTTTIQTGSDYNTLNVSHAAAIFLFAFSARFKSIGAKSEGRASRNTNNRREKDLVVRLFVELATASEFQEFKRNKLSEAVSRLLNRSDPSLRELYLMMGVASRATSKIKRLTSINMVRTG